MKINVSLALKKATTICTLFLGFTGKAISCTEKITLNHYQEPVLGKTTCLLTPKATTPSVDVNILFGFYMDCKLLVHLYLGHT